MKSSNSSGKFLSLPSKIVTLRFLRTPPVPHPWCYPWIHVSRGGGEKRNLDPPLPPSHGSFVNDCIVSSELLLKHLSCRSFFRSGVKSKYQGLLTFRTKYKVFKGGRKFILARLHFGEYLALASLNIRGTLATTLSPWPSLPGWSLPPRFFMACFSRFSSLLKNQLSTFELQMPPSETIFISHLACHLVEGLHGVNR